MATKAQKDSKNYEAVAAEKINYRTPIGYFQSKRAINILERHLVLVTYFMEDRGVSKEILEPTPKIDEFIKNYNKKQRRNLLHMEISKNMNTVLSILKRVGVPTIYIRSRKGDKSENINIITDFFNIPSDERLQQYNTIRLAIYRAIGHYEAIKNRRSQDMFNPVYWLSIVLNIPVMVLSRSGINVETEKTYKMHYWITQVLLAMLLSFIILKLGINIVEIAKNLITSAI